MRPHRTDTVSLTFALLFLAVAAWWLLAQLVDLALPAIGWFGAVALILLGAVGLVGALRSGRDRSPTSDNPAAPVTAAPADVRSSAPPASAATPPADDKPVTAPPADG